MTYDAIYNDFVEDVPFYQRIAEEAGGAVCELACGSGRVTVPLAKAGITLTGIDSSEEMLSTARARAEAAGISAERLSLLHGDMRSPPVNTEYSLVVIPLHSLSHLHTNQDVRECFYAVKEMLRPGGRFAFAIHNPEPAVLARDPGEIERVNEWASSIAVYESSSYDTAAQLLHLAWYIEGREETDKFEYTLRMFFPQEILELLSGAGFIVEERFGWYDRSLFTSECGTQIIVARRD